MRRIDSIAVGSILLAASAAFSPAAAQIEESDLNFFNPYGSFRAHMAFSGKSAEIENNSSGIGLMMVSDPRSGWSLSARGEWGINLVKNETSFSLDDGIYASGHGRNNVLTLGIWMDFAKLRRKH